MTIKTFVGILAVAASIVYGTVYFHQYFVSLKHYETAIHSRHANNNRTTETNRTPMVVMINGSIRGDEEASKNATIQLLHRDEVSEQEVMHEASDKKGNITEETQPEPTDETKAKQDVFVDLTEEGSSSGAVQTPSPPQGVTTMPQNSTLSANSSAPDVPKPKPLSEMTEEDKKAAEIAFYQHHHEQMKLLVNESSLIDWNRERPTKGKYSRWLELFNYTNLPKSTLVGLGLEQYKFLRYDKGLCIPAKLFTEYRAASINANNTLPRIRHVLLSKVNQDFGAFSTFIPGVTGKFGNLVADWNREGCSEEMIFDYINHPDTLAVFTIQFQIYDHPKVISITLGLSPSRTIGPILTASQQYSPTRPDLLMINMMGRGGPKGPRAAVPSVMQKFQEQLNITMVNTYNNYGDGTSGTRNCSTSDKKKVIICYFGEMLTSKFIVSPPGLGLDCYRHWEAMFMGTIPLLERSSKYKKTDGWFRRTLADLPLAWIDSYENLTPEYLEQEYARIVYQTEPSVYNYRKLTRWYWRDLAYAIANEEVVLTPPPNGKTFYTD